MDNKIHLAIVGTGEVSVRVGAIIEMLYNPLAVKHGADALSVDRFVVLWRETDEVKHSDIKGINVFTLSEAIECYKNGEIEGFIVPQGICSYAIPIMLLDGVREESVYCMRADVYERDDFSNIALDDILTSYVESGYLHPVIPLPVDNTKRMLGKHKHVCAICGTEGEFNSYLAREMMQDKRDEFEYFVCSNCFCLQIAKVPDNLGEYYGEVYYSFALQEDRNRQYSVPVTNMDKILDVGCGSGVWLVKMAENGYGNLHGADPFLANEIRHGDRVHIRNCSIHELDEDGTYDYIRFSDSFEHVTDPHEVLQSARRLLKDNGAIEIKIPTYPNIAFDVLGPHWYQLDAPRHISLHSIKSIKVLAESNSLRIRDCEYDSNCGQFIRSLMYMHNTPFYKADKEVEKYLSGVELYELECLAKEADERKYGDHMTVWLVKD